MVARKKVDLQPLFSVKRQALGKTWTVELWPSDTGLGLATGTASRSPYLGRASFVEQWIKIVALRPFDGRDSTLLHEIIHLASDTSEANLKEGQVTVLAEALYAFLRGFGLWNAFPWADQEV
jgi:hypothetical protein